MREFNIKVQVYETSEEAPYETQVNFPHYTGDGYLVTINKKQIASHGLGYDSAAISLAHEFGHVVAAEMDLPVSKSMKTPGYGLYFTDHAVKMKVENEAWDMAQFIMHRAYAIKTHEAANSQSLFTMPFYDSEKK